MEKIDHDKTALVVIDLQKGIAAMDRHLAPHSAQEVIKNASMLADVCRGNNIPVFLVHVLPTKETALSPECDAPMFSSNRGNQEIPKEWADFVQEMRPKKDDIVITKHQWGAFYGTELEMQLRRRKIDTIILCGISTNIGVESTARFAYEYGYSQIFAEDAMAAMSAEEHNMSVSNIFKRIGKVRNTKDIIGAM